MNPANKQVLLFQHLKSQLPNHISMVDAVAELLNISNDSAYRRIRGEKPIDLEETYTLCRHFKISMDQLLHLQSDAFIFTGILKGNSNETAFAEYLQNVLYNLQVINSFEKKHLYCLMKDIPHFEHFLIPELMIFKCFFWMKSILHDERLKGVKFSLQDPIYEQYTEYGRKIIEMYNQIPNTEIWNIESLNSSLNQVNFYAEAGSFADKKDIKILYEKIELLINHIEKEAEMGLKFNIGEKPKPNAASFRMFVNELILGDNTYLAEIGENRVSFLNHSVLYFVGTRDERFNDSMYANLQNLMKKSTMISTIGEKERESFFNRLRDKIHKRIAQLK